MIFIWCYYKISTESAVIFKQLRITVELLLLGSIPDYSGIVTYIRTQLILGFPSKPTSFLATEHQKRSITHSPSKA